MPELMTEMVRNDDIRSWSTLFMQENVVFVFDEYRWLFQSRFRRRWQYIEMFEFTLNLFGFVF